MKWSATITWNLKSRRADFNGAFVEFLTSAWADTSRLNGAADRTLIGYEKGQRRSVTSSARAGLGSCETPEVSATAPSSGAIVERERFRSLDNTLANLLVERSQLVRSWVECSNYQDSYSRVAALPESRAYEVGANDLGTHDRTLVESCSTN